MLVFVLFLIISSSISIAQIEIIEIISKEKITQRDTSTTRHVYAIGHLADISSGSITYLHQDRIHSNRIATNSDG